MTLEDHSPSTVLDAAPRLGEVIEASTGTFVAESYRLHDAPSFGSLIRTTDGPIQIYGVTAGARTGSLDAGRPPTARGQNEQTEEDIYRHNPELSELLRTEFTAVVVGFVQDGRPCQYLPPRPSHVHSFVYQCSPDEIRAFTARLDFLATLLAAGQRGSTDELAAACLRETGHAYPEARPYLVRAGKELAALLGTELSRLNSILRRIRA